MIRRTTIPLFLILAARLSAQEPVQPYDATGRYRTSGIEAQLTGAFGDGRDVMFSWGLLGAGGGQGRWMHRTELALGLRAGQSLVDRLMLGPQVSLALAVPAWYTVLDGGTRAEPYLLVSGGALGVADFEDGSDLGLSPVAGAGVGVRLFEDEWDIALTHIEVLVQKRFGIAEGAPQLYVRFSRALPRRRAAPSTPRPDALVPIPPLR